MNRLEHKAVQVAVASVSSDYSPSAAIVVAVDDRGQVWMRRVYSDDSGGDWVRIG